MLIFILFGEKDYTKSIFSITLIYLFICFYFYLFFIIINLSKFILFDVSLLYLYINAS